MLLYWEYCDKDKDPNAPVIASKYYKTLRNLEDCKCMTSCNGTDINFQQWHWLQTREYSLPKITVVIKFMCSEYVGI